MSGRSVFLLAVVALTAAAAETPAANAATLSERQATGLPSAQIDGSAVYWFQHVADRKTGRVGGGRILRRELGAATPEVIFEAGRDKRVTGFNAARGRVAVGTQNVRTGASQVLEIRQTGAAWSSTSLAGRTGTRQGDVCFSIARVITVNVASEIVVEDLQLLGRDGKCGDSDIKRPQSTLFAIAADGTTRTLVERKGAWTLTGEIATIPDLTWGAGDWLFFSLDGADFVEPAGLLNIDTGQSVAMFDPPSPPSHMEVSAGGRTITNVDGQSTILRTDPQNPDFSINFSRPHLSRWLHFCGEKILEISRRGHPWADWPSRKHKYPNGSRWNLYILSLDGQRERRLPDRLHRGTVFETCDANTAVFYRGLRNGRTRQFSLSLAAPVQ